MEYRTKYLDIENRREAETETFCVRCKRDIKGEPELWVHLIDGGPFVLHPEQERAFMTAATNFNSDEAAGELGFHPIGPDCARKLGREWVHHRWPPKTSPSETEKSGD